MRIGDLDVHVTVSERRRTVRLTVERDATITAVIPPATNEAKLARAITAKRPGLYAKLRERAETGMPRPWREFVSGESFPTSAEAIASCSSTRQRAQSSVFTTAALSCAAITRTTGPPSSPLVPPVRLAQHGQDPPACPVPQSCGSVAGRKQSNGQGSGPS
jgi:hypothetical protein